MINCYDSRLSPFMANCSELILAEIKGNLRSLSAVVANDLFLFFDRQAYDC